MDMRIPTLETKVLLESSPLKSRLLVCRLAVPMEILRRRALDQLCARKAHAGPADRRQQSSSRADEDFARAFVSWTHLRQNPGKTSMRPRSFRKSVGWIPDSDGGGGLTWNCLTIFNNRISSNSSNL